LVIQITFVLTILNTSPRIGFDTPGRETISPNPGAWKKGVMKSEWMTHKGERFIYCDFTPAALLDWEMAGLGPRELDVAWCQ